MPTWNGIGGGGAKVSIEFSPDNKRWSPPKTATLRYLKPSVPSGRSDRVNFGHEDTLVGGIGRITALSIQPTLDVHAQTFALSLAEQHFL